MLEVNASDFSISVLGYLRQKTSFCGELCPGVQFVVQEYLLYLGLNVPYPKPVHAMVSAPGQSEVSRKL